MIPALGFMPDADPTVQGAFLDCVNIIPTLRGFASARGLNDSGVAPLVDPVIGSGIVTKLNNIRRLFVGTPTGIYENVGTSWEDVSKSGGYTPGAENSWRFAQFGNATLAANQMDKIQASVEGDFADIPQAPKARIIETVAGFVMAFATNDETYGDEPDRWWSSGLYDHTAWEPSQATQAATGRLMDSPGEIRAAKKLGNDIVAYKERSMYLGRYMGPPIIWSWQQIPGEIGAISQEAVVSIDTAHVFIGNDDFWLYDGSRPQPIGAPVREWFFSNIAPEFVYKTIGYYDRFNGLVYWYFASRASVDGTLDQALVYNVKTNKWGRIQRTITAAIQYVSQGLTFDNIGDVYPTFDDITGISYDSPQWFAQGETPAVFIPGGRLMLLSGESEPSEITLNDIGDDYVYSTLSTIRPRFLASPETGEAFILFRQSVGDELQYAGQAPMFDRKFDFMNEARWHRVILRFTGDIELTGFDIRLIPGGDR